MNIDEEIAVGYLLMRKMRKNTESPKKSRLVEFFKKE